MARGNAVRRSCNGAAVTAEPGAPPLERAAAPAQALGGVFGMSPGAGAVSLAGRDGEPCAVAYAAEHTIVLVREAAARRQAFLQVCAWGRTPGGGLLGAGTDGCAFRPARGAGCVLPWARVPAARTRAPPRSRARAEAEPRAQGHRNAVTCLEAPPDRSFLVSADAGPDSLLVAWDPESEQPLWSVRAPHEGGVAAMALSGDGRLLATLSAPRPPAALPACGGSSGGGGGDGTGAQQELTVWRLPDLRRPAQQAEGEGGDTACAERVASSSVPGQEPQRWVRFNPEDASELVTNGARRIYFWRVTLDGATEAAAPAGGGVLSYYSPPRVAADFRQAGRVGDFLASAFVPGSTQVRGCQGLGLSMCAATSDAGVLCPAKAPRRSRDHALPPRATPY